MIDDPSVKLNDYVYPIGAQIIGWFIVAILVGPFPIYIGIHLYKKRHHVNMEEFKHVNNKKYIDLFRPNIKK